MNMIDKSQYTSIRICFLILNQAGVSTSFGQYCPNPEFYQIYFDVGFPEEEC